MRRLILFRHAKAAARANGQADRDRPLEASGGEDARVAGAWLAAGGLAPDLVLVSPSLRTRQTWDSVADLFPAARVETVEAIYEAAPEDIEAAIAQESAGADAVMVVGHNPGLQELAVNLLSDSLAAVSEIDRVAGAFPTSTLAVLALEDDGRARLEALYCARRDRALGTRGEGGGAP